jgi:uncharacterized protein
MSDPRKVNRLPRHVDPRKLAAQGAHLQGVVPARELERLADAVVKAEEYVDVDLTFGRDHSHRHIVHGAFRLPVDLSCQRCLQPVATVLSGEFHLGVVWDEERATALPKALEAWLVATESADLYELVEEELLLALPIVAYHQQDQCPARGDYSTGEVADTRPNPFGILAQLKK